MKHLKLLYIRFFEYIIFLPLSLIIIILPFKMAHIACYRLCLFLRKIDKRIKKRILTNLSICFPDNTHEENLKLYEDLWKYFGEVVTYIFKPTHRSVYEQTDIIGMKHLKEAHAKGKGVILLSAHLGYWDIGLANCNKEMGCVDALFINLRTRAKVFQKLYRMSRNQICSRAIERTEHSGLHIMRALRKNRIVAILSDLNGNDKFTVPFFGKEAICAQGTLTLAHKAKAPVIPVYCVKENGRFKLVIEPEMQLTGDEYTDAVAMHVMFERWVKQYPEQFLSLKFNKWNIKGL